MDPLGGELAGGVNPLAHDRHDFHSYALHKERIRILRWFPGPPLRGHGRPGRITVACMQGQAPATRGCAGDHERPDCGPGVLDLDG